MNKNNFYDIKPLLGNKTKITLPNHIKIGTYIFNIKSINFIKYEKSKLYIHYYDINNEIHCVSANVSELEYKYIANSLCTTIIEEVNNEN